MSARLHVLANGVRVLCDPLPGFETLALSVVAGRGARWEDERHSGWSHLLEHMVFKGAGERSARDIVEVIEAEGGQINAATGYERTSFQVRALAGSLPLAMALTSDLVLRPTLDAAELEREKGVIGQEIAEAADMPDDLVFDLAQDAAFAGQPLGRPVLGTVESVATADTAALGQWRSALYSADRLVVSASGAVDEDELVALTEAYFGDARRAEAATDPQPGVFVGGLAPRARRLEQAHLVLLLPGLATSHPDHFALRVFVEILGGGMASRLFQEARERLGLAYAIDAYAESYADVGVMGVYAGCAARDARRLAEVAAREIRNLAEGATPAELSRAKAQLKASVFMARESLSARAEQAAAQMLILGRILSPVELAERIETVTLGDLARVGEGLLAGRRSAAAVLGPKTALLAADAFAAAIVV